MKNHFLIVLMAAIPIFGITDCGNAPLRQKGRPEFFKSFNRAERYAQGLPASYKWTDYRLIAEKFHNLAFDNSASGGFLPLSWAMGEGIGIRTYVGDTRNQGSYGEAITLLPALVCARLNGFDIEGKLPAANAYFCDAEGVILNNSGSSSAGMSMWYMLFPALHYTWLSLLSPDETIMRQNCLTTISRWYDAYQLMKDSHFTNTSLTRFTVRNFNFLNNTPALKEPDRNWSEPDSAAGMAVLFYTGYKLSGEQKYLDAAKHLLDWLAAIEGGPLYEVLHFFTPAMMALFNDFHNGSYDITRVLNQNFDGYSIARNGWGAMAGSWGSIPVNGLFGSVNDRGGYAFSMNTFAAAGAIAPLARYDARYARSIGKWLLHLHSNARYFFSEESNQSNQSYYNSNVSGQLDPRIVAAIPYEGIIKEHNGKLPWFGGDPTINGWAATDFSLYSGSQTGILGALYSQTNVEGILKINVSVTQIVPVNEWPGFLLYNPHNSQKLVNYNVSSTEAVNLFDTVTNTMLAENVSEMATFAIPANGAKLIVEIPVDQQIVKQGHSYFAGSRYVSTEHATIVLSGINTNNAVSGKLQITALLETNTSENGSDAIDSSTLIIGDREIPFSGKITLDTKEFDSGVKRVYLIGKTKNGFIDYTETRLQIK
ncbi:MAG: hypothetical protein LBH43_02165 [Treponema sp.]|jgi:hypothetical protein|nr:hypothetical protein [Treponema sp.]